MSNIDNARPGNQIKISADFDTTDPLPGDIELFYNIVEDLTVVDGGDISSVAISPTTNPLVSTDGTNSVVFTASSVGTTAFVDYVWSVGDPNRALSSTMANGAKFVINWDDRPNISNAPITISVSASVAGDATTVSDSLNTNIQYTTSTVSSLVEGSDPPQSWARTTDSSTLDTEDGPITLQSSYGDDSYFTGAVPMRFITPAYNDISEQTTVEVVAHPYGGVAKGAADEFESPPAILNTYDIYMSLNNGQWKKAVKTTRTSSTTGTEYTTYKCDMPATLTQQSSRGNYGFGEVRAVCIPAYGKPTILQGLDQTNEDCGLVKGSYSIDQENRGCRFAEYSTFSVAANWDAETGSSSNKKLILTGDSTQYKMSDFAYADSSWDKDGETIPIVYGGKVEPAKTYSSGHAVGNLYINTDMRTPITFDPAEMGTVICRSTADNGDESTATVPRFVFNNVKWGTAKDTTYDPTADATALGITTVAPEMSNIIADGFGVMVRAFYKDLTAEVFAWGFNDTTGNTSPMIQFYKSECRWGAITAKEVVDSSTLAATYKNDIWGETTLQVGSGDYFVSTWNYPYGPVGKDTIRNNGGWDFDEHANRYTYFAGERNKNQDVVTDGLKAMFTGATNSDVIFDANGGPTNEGAYTGWASGKSVTNNLLDDKCPAGYGIWPTWYQGGSPEIPYDRTGLYATQDEIGNVYTSYPFTSWGVGPDGSENDHHDVSQIKSTYDGSTIMYAYESLWLGEANRQGVKWNDTKRFDETAQVAVWDVTMSQEYQDALNAYWGDGQNMHWGPGNSSYSVRGGNTYGGKGYGQFNPGSFFYIEGQNDERARDFNQNGAKTDTAEAAMSDHFIADANNIIDPADNLGAYQYIGNYSPTQGGATTLETRRTVSLTDILTNAFFTPNPQTPPGSGDEWQIKFSEARLPGNGQTEMEAYFENDGADYTRGLSGQDTPQDNCVVLADPLDYAYSSSTYSVRGAQIDASGRVLIRFTSTTSRDNFFNARTVVDGDQTTTLRTRLNGVDWTIVANNPTPGSNTTWRTRNEESGRIQNSSGGSLLFNGSSDPAAFKAAWEACGPSEIEILEPLSASALIPGTDSFGDWAPLTASPVGTDERQVAAHIIEAPLNAVTGNTVEISVQAEHATGIERVEVYANGNVATVTERAERTWTDISSADSDADGLPNSPVFTVTMDMTNVNAGESVEVRAIAYPNDGVPRILQGDPTVAGEEMNVPVSEQSQSVVFTKIAGVDDEAVTIDNVTGYGIRAAIGAYNYSNDRMVRFIVPDTSNATDVGPNWNDSDAAIATPNGSFNKYIPVVVRGALPNRGVNTYNQNIGDSNGNGVADATAIRVEEGYVQLENFTLYQGHMLINMGANQGCIINDCHLTRELVVVDSFRGTTLTGNVSQYQSDSDDWWTDPAAVPETVVGATRWVFSQQAAFNDTTDPPQALIKDTTTFGSPLKAGCGTVILNSTIEGNANMGNNVVLQRNNVHRNNMQDVASASAVLNILVTKSNFGSEVAFLCGGVDKVFNPAHTYNQGDRVFGQPSPSASVEDWSLWTLDAGTSTPSSRSANGGAFTTDGSDAGCTWRRTDPHVDGYQPPVTPRNLSTDPPYIHPTPAQPNEDPPVPADPGQGYRILDNVIVQGYDFDLSAFCQPYICTEWGDGQGDTVGFAVAMVDWNMRGQQMVDLAVRSQWQTSMYHWIMRGVNYKGPSWRQYFGLINFPQDGNPVDLDNLAVGERPSDFGKALVLHLEDTNLGNFTATPTAVNEGDDISVWIDNVNNNVTGVTVSTAGTVEGTYGAQSPSGSATLAGLEFVGQTLTVNTNFSNYESISYSWERSDDGSTGWSTISGATSTSYVLTSSDQGKHVRAVVTAVGLPPDAVSTAQTVGAIGAALESLGSFSFTYQGANVDDGATISYTEVTDDSARTGVFLAKGRYEAGGTGSNTFDGTLSDDSGSFRLGPGYSDAGDNTGLYGSPTYASTGNTSSNVETWRDFFDPDVVVVVSATKRPNAADEATFVSSFELSSEPDSTIGVLGGYFNLSWSKLGWNSITDIQDGLGVGDEVTITAYRP